jgi:hypothetical protein
VGMCPAGAFRMHLRLAGGAACIRESGVSAACRLPARAATRALKRSAVAGAAHCPGRHDAGVVCGSACCLLRTVEATRALDPAAGVKRVSVGFLLKARAAIRALDRTAVAGGVFC